MKKQFVPAPMHHAMKTYGIVKVYVYRFLNSVSVRSTLKPLYP